MDEWDFWEEVDLAIEEAKCESWSCAICPVSKWYSRFARYEIPECYEGLSCGEMLKKIANTEVTHKNENRRAYD